MRTFLFVLLIFLVACSNQAEETNVQKKSYRRLVIKESNYDSFIVASSHIDSVNVLSFLFKKKEAKYVDIAALVKRLKVTSLGLMGPNIDLRSNDHELNENVEFLWLSSYTLNLDSINRFPNVKTLTLAGNYSNSEFEAVFKLYYKSVKEIVLFDIKHIPISLELMKNVEKLLIQSDSLETLDFDFKKLKNLQDLDISLTPVGKKISLMGSNGIHANDSIAKIICEDCRLQVLSQMPYK